MAAGNSQQTAMTDNVVRLPTAAPRKVKQRYNAQLRAYKAANPWPGEFKRPSEREAGLTKSPELLILMAIFKQLTTEQKAEARRIVSQVASRSPGPEAQAAYNVVTELS